MSLAVRSSPSLKASAARKVACRASVRPVAALTVPQATKVAAAGVASMAMAAALTAAPVEAHNLVSTIASATEGYPFVPPSWAPSVLVPLTGLVIPAIAMATLFVYIEKDAPQQ